MLFNKTFDIYNLKLSSERKTNLEKYKINFSHTEYLDKQTFDKRRTPLVGGVLLDRRYAKKKRKIETTSDDPDRDPKANMSLKDGFDFTLFAYLLSSALTHMDENGSIRDHNTTSS